MEKIFEIDILSDNLESSHPVLANWRNGMKNAGYSPEQIQQYFKQQINQQMKHQKALQSQHSLPTISRMVIMAKSIIYSPSLFEI